MKYCPLCSADLVNIIHENNYKLACSSKKCGYIFWNNPIPVVLGLVNFQDKYVITNNMEWPEWKFSLISGFVDFSEDPRTAIQREVKEELNLEATKIELITVSLYEKLNQLMISYHVDTKGELQLNQENRSYKLLTKEELVQWKFGAGATPSIKLWLKRNL